jgi:hypothetical protein
MKMAPEPDARTADVAGTAQAYHFVSASPVSCRRRDARATRRFACTMLILVRKNW